jgi:hypothetical protein
MLNRHAQLDRIVGSMHRVQLGAAVSLGGLHRGMVWSAKNMSDAKNDFSSSPESCCRLARVGLDSDSSTALEPQWSKYA